MEAPTNRVSYFGAIEPDSGRQADPGLPQNSSNQCQAGPSQDLITFEGVAQQLSEEEAFRSLEIPRDSNPEQELDSALLITGRLAESIHHLEQEITYLEQRQRLLVMRCIISSITFVVLLTSFVLVCVFVIHPYMVAHPFHSTTCRVLNITSPGDHFPTGCSEVRVQYVDHDLGTSIVSFLHLDENHLKDKCIPESFLPNCTDIDPPRLCLIPCFYNPSSNMQVIEHRKFQMHLDSVLIICTLALIPSRLTLIFCFVYPFVWQSHVNRQSMAFLLDHQRRFYD